MINDSFVKDKVLYMKGLYYYRVISKRAGFQSLGKFLFVKMSDYFVSFLYP